jgi:NAD+--asparagine ADP-ribosyltransferase
MVCLFVHTHAQHTHTHKHTHTTSTHTHTIYLLSPSTYFRQSTTKKMKEAYTKAVNERGKASRQRLKDVPA